MSHSADSRSDFSGWGSRGGWTGGDWNSCSRGGNDGVEPSDIFSLGDNSMVRKRRRICPQGKRLKFTADCVKIRRKGKKGKSKKGKSKKSKK